MNRRVTVVGGGLAGSEAAWQLARRGIEVLLLEMRPLRTTPAHTTEMLAEVVCSNSFGADGAASPMTTSPATTAMRARIESMSSPCHTSVDSHG